MFHCLRFFEWLFIDSAVNLRPHLVLAFDLYVQLSYLFVICENQGVAGIRVGCYPAY